MAPNKLTESMSSGCDYTWSTFSCSQSRYSDSSTSSDCANDRLYNNNNNYKTSCESLNALLMEEALICGELQEIQMQQFSDCDAEDEDLREFQRIENEIKVSELNKCLRIVQKQINNYNRKRDSMKSQKSNKSDVTINDYGSAPLAESESYADETERSTETEKEDSIEIKSDDTLYLDMERPSQSPSPTPTPKQIFNKKSQQRPLTLYLPSPDEDLNLLNHIQTLGHDLINQPSLHITQYSCSGYLFKLCSNSESKWRKRFFHFDRQHKIFVYYRNKKSFQKSRKTSGGVYFDEIHDVYVDHTRMKPKNGDIGTRSVFIVAAATRQFVLSTLQPELMRIWIDVIFTGAQAYQDFDD